MTLQTPSSTGGANAQLKSCRVHLVAAGAHELVPGGVPLADERLLSLDADARRWLDEQLSHHVIFVVPAAGERAEDADGVLARPTRSVVVNVTEYRSLLGLSLLGLRPR